MLTGDGSLAECEVAEFFVESDGEDKQIDEYIRAARVRGLRRFEDSRLRWFKHVRRRAAGCIGRRMLNMELQGKREIRPKQRCVYVWCRGLGGHAGGDGTKEDAEDRKRCKWMIDP